MKELTLLQQKYLEVAQLFHWGRQVDFTAWFTGEWNPRNKNTESVMPRLVEANKLQTMLWGNKLIYTTSKRASSKHVPHGLACTRVMILLKHSTEGEFVSEKYFRATRFPIVPEFALRTEKKALLVEFSTSDNFKRSSVMRDKITRYRQSLPKFADTFGVQPLVLFIVEAPRFAAIRLARSGDENFYFVDAKSYLSLPMGNQLTAPIYIWGGDGQTYPLKK